MGRTGRVAERKVYGPSKNIDVRATVGVNLEIEVILVVLQLEEDYPLALSTRCRNK